MKNIPNNVLFVITGVIEIYSSILRKARLRAVRKVPDRRKEKKISTENLVKMAMFVLKNKYFEFNGKIKHQKLCTAIGSKFTLKYTYIFMIQKHRLSLAP